MGHQGYFLAPLPGSEAPLVRKQLYSVLKFIVTCYYGKQSFEGFVRGIFTSTGEQEVAPHPTEPTENIYYEIRSGMIEKLLANPYAGDGTLHPDMHLIYVDEVCRLFKLAGLSEDDVKKMVFPLSLKGKSLNGIGYVKILEFGITTD